MRGELRLIKKFYRLLLAFYPAEFRAEFGAEMEDVFTIALAHVQRSDDERFWLLVWREISTRYRQSVLGIGWAVFRPLISALIFTLVFSVMVKVKTDIPYPIFAFSALIPWMNSMVRIRSLDSSLWTLGIWMVLSLTNCRAICSMLAASMV